MIISRLSGGLGNQMFQFAAAYSLAAELDVPLKLDASLLRSSSTQREYELANAFGIEALASREDIRRLLGWRSVLRRAASNRFVRPFCGGNLVVEPYFHFWSGLFESRDNSYLVGYWQSEKYFDRYREPISKVFAFSNALTTGALEVADEISAVESVGVHVRRGDYVVDPSVNAYHGVCAPEYYRQAVALISAKQVDANYFVFSDDIEWAERNLSLPRGARFYRNLGGPPYEDMRLMSLCRHQIIANSSFSWWAAWLNANAKKMVVAPKRWFAAANLDGRDLAPSEWFRL